MPSQQDLIVLLRRYPYLVRAEGRFPIVDVRLAKRKYETAVLFKFKWTLATVRERPLSAEPMVRGGSMVLDTERGVWVDLDSLRSMAKCFGYPWSPPAPILDLFPVESF
jgi:hypothetical protein